VCVLTHAAAHPYTGPVWIVLSHGHLPTAFCLL
jgi:hypothetical protein